MVDFGCDDVVVVIDPIDGSMNAKRGLTPTRISIAVADGHTMADVEFGYVFDFGTDEEWVARRGEGVLLNGAPLPERRRPSAATATASSSSSRSSPPTRAGSRQRSTSCWSTSTASARWARSRSRSCQVALTRVDGMVDAVAARARSTAAAGAAHRARERRLRRVPRLRADARLAARPRAARPDRRRADRARTCELARGRRVARPMIDWGLAERIGGVRRGRRRRAAPRSPATSTRSPPRRVERVIAVHRAARRRATIPPPEAVDRARVAAR